jgi:hypothetical protein
VSAPSDEVAALNCSHAILIFSDDFCPPSLIGSTRSVVGGAHAGSTSLVGSRQENKDRTYDSRRVSDIFYVWGMHKVRMLAAPGYSEDIYQECVLLFSSNALFTQSKVEERELLYLSLA